MASTKGFVGRPVERGLLGSTTMVRGGGLVRSCSRWVLVVLAVSSAVPIVTVWSAGAWFHDDCYITLRYARNLSAGNGFVFNAGAPTLGTTTPLYALWLASLHLLLSNVDLVQIVRVSGAACWLAAGWLVIAFRRALQLAPNEAGVVAAAVLVAGNVRSTAMEAPAFAAMLVLFLGLLARSLHRAPANGSDQAVVGATVGFAMLVRGEAALLGAIAVASQTWVVRRKVPRPRARWLLSSWPMGIGFAAVVGTWAAYALPTFGHALPASLEIKRLQTESGKWPSFACSMLFDWLPHFESQFRAGVDGGASLLLRYMNPWFLLVAFGAIAVARRYPRCLPVPMFGLAYTLAYTALRIPSYWWYALPVLFTGHLLAALGLARLLRLRDRASSRRWRVARIAAIVAYLGLLAAPRLADAARGPVEERRDSYRKLAAWFEENARRDEAIAYVEIGYLGYFTENPILDLCGLASPEMVPFLRRGDLAGAVFAYRPKWYVHGPDFHWLDGAVVSDPRFAQNYERVAVLPGPRQSPLQIWRLRDRIGARQVFGTR